MTVALAEARARGSLQKARRLGEMSSPGWPAALLGLLRHRQSLCRPAASRELLELQLLLDCEFAEVEMGEASQLEAQQREKLCRGLPMPAHRFVEGAGSGS